MESKYRINKYDEIFSMYVDIYTPIYHTQRLLLKLKD